MRQRQLARNGRESVGYATAQYMSRYHRVRNPECSAPGLDRIAEDGIDWSGRKPAADAGLGFCSIRIRTLSRSLLESRHSIDDFVWYSQVLHRLRAFWINDMTLKNRNHYVPCLSLRRWADTESKLWVYRLLVSHASVPLWKHSSIDGIGYHRNLYTRILAGAETDEFENWLERDFETPARNPFGKRPPMSGYRPMTGNASSAFLPPRTFERQRAWSNS
jgi:hypothetical protein